MNQLGFFSYIIDFWFMIMVEISDNFCGYQIVVIIQQLMNKYMMVILYVNKIGNDNKRDGFFCDYWFIFLYNFIGYVII